MSWLDSAKQWARSIGYLDDIILVPLGILLAVRLVPAEIMTEHRATAAVAGDRPVSRIAAAVIVGVWVVALAIVSALAWRQFG